MNQSCRIYFFIFVFIIPFTDIESLLSNFAVKDHKVVSVPSIVKVPKCYLPQVSIPRVSITEDFVDCSLTSDSSGSAEPGKDGDTDESKVYIRADFIPRVPVTEDFGEGGLTSDSSGSAEPEKNGDTDENKVYIRVDLIPRVPVTEDFGDGGLASDLSRPGRLEKDHGPEKDGNIDDENKVNIRASPIPRPRAVISSPGKSHTPSIFCLAIFVCIIDQLLFCNFIV